MTRATSVLGGALLALAAACASAPPPSPPVAAPAPEVEPSRAVRFGRGRARVSLPARYQTDVTEEGTLEARTTGPGAIVRLFIDVHPIEEYMPDQTPTPGQCIAFLRDRARQKGLSVVEHGDRAVSFEAGVNDVVEGAVVQNLHFQVCAGEVLFVMTMVAREADRDAPEVKRFFESELDPIVASLSARGQ